MARIRLLCPCLDRTRGSRGEVDYLCSTLSWLIAQSGHYTGAQTPDLVEVMGDQWGNRLATIREGIFAGNYGGRWRNPVLGTSSIFPPSAQADLQYPTRLYLSA